MTILQSQQWNQPESDGQKAREQDWVTSYLFWVMTCLLAALLGNGYFWHNNDVLTAK